MKTKFRLPNVLLLLLLVALNGQPADANENPDGRQGREAKTDVDDVPAGAWEFYYLAARPDADRLAEKSSYKFGQEAGCLYDMFLDCYVRREQMVAGDNTSRMVIRKPAIYNAVRSIERHLGRTVDGDGNVSRESSDIFTRVLQIAVAAVGSDSDTFEDALHANRKNANDLLSLFDNVTLKEL